MEKNNKADYILNHLCANLKGGESVDFEALRCSAPEIKSHYWSKIAETLLDEVVIDDAGVSFAITLPETEHLSYQIQVQYSYTQKTRTT